MNPPHSLNSALADLEPSIVRRGVKSGGTSKSRLLSDLAEAAVQLNEYARVLFASDLFTTSPTEQHWMTVEVSVRDLGFTQGACIQKIHRRASDLGLLPPPLELAPHLRLQYRDQPEGFWGHPVTQHRAPPGSITIASVPLSEDDDLPKGFYLRRIEGTLWLRGYQCPMDNHWNPDDHLLFCQS